MTEQERSELRCRRNAYNSSVAAARGFVSGKRRVSMQLAERALREALWQHRDAIVELLTRREGP